MPGDIQMFEQWAWVAQEKDGTENMVVAMIPLLKRQGPLAHRSEDIARSMQPLAREYAEQFGTPVRLVFMKEIRNASMNGGR